MQAKPAGGPWGTWGPGAEAQLPPDGRRPPEGAGMCHCVPALPVTARQGRFVSLALAALAVSRPQALGVCVPKPVRPMGKPSREGQEQTKTRDTHTQSPAGRLSS